MVFSYYTLGALLVVACAAQQYTTPVPILRQLNKHNEDGSYSYGYEGADGSFKIETKYPNGEVYGKYGYVDDQGQRREIEYGATKRGFEPAGTGITVPPPTIGNDNNVDYGDDDGQYREDPTQYYSSETSARRPSSNHHASNFGNFNLPTARAAPAQAPVHHNPAPVHHQPAPVHQAPVAAYRPPLHHAPVPRADPNQFRGHPATNVDINTGSYTLTYTG